MYLFSKGKKKKNIWLIFTKLIYDNKAFIFEIFKVTKIISSAIMQ